jgi:predicted DNA-binding antitoxin AbrB/MazE fold protein
MEKRITAVFDGKVFVPTEPIELPIGKRVLVTVCVASKPTEEEKEEAEQILRGNGGELPWATVEEALGHPRYEP